MSKGLEALKRFKQPLMMCDLDWNNRIEIIEKELKALEIIKEKRVNVDNFLNRVEKDTDYKEYKRLCDLYKIMIFSGKELTQDEFDLLKEVLEKSKYIRN